MTAAERRLARAWGMRGARGAAAVATALVVLAAGAIVAAPALATPVRCGTVITRSIVLADDVGPCSGDGLIVGADNITVDLNRKRVFGTPGPGNGSTVGIRLPARKGVAVRGGTVSGFDAGVFVNRGSGNSIQSMIVRDNIGPRGDPERPELNPEFGDGIVAFNSANNRIVSNIVRRNGFYDGIGILGPGSDGNLVQGNAIEDNLGTPGDPTFTFVGNGVIINNFLDENDVRRGQSVYDNKVLGNLVRRNGSGIANISNVRGVIARNVVVDNGLQLYGVFEELPANGIGIQKSAEATEAMRVVVEENTVVHNGIVGIFVQRFASENRIQNNVVYSNGLVGIYVHRGAHDNVIRNNRTGYNGLLDLADLAAADGDVLYREAPCDVNLWFGNTWGPPQPNDFSAVFPVPYFPDCVTAGGSGPNPPSAPSAPSAPALNSAAEAARPPVLGGAEGPTPGLRRPSRPS